MIQSSQAQHMYFTKMLPVHVDEEFVSHALRQASAPFWLSRYRG